MGSSCSCTKDGSADDSPRKEKSNGHVLENGAHHDGGAAAAAQNGHIGDTTGETRGEITANGAGNIGNGVLHNDEERKGEAEVGTDILQGKTVPSCPEGNHLNSRNAWLTATPPNTPALPISATYQQNMSEEGKFLAGRLTVVLHIGVTLVFERLSVPFVMYV